MTLFWIFLISAVIIAAAWFYHHNKTESLASEGKIIKRGNDFYEKASEFTLTLSDKSLVTEGLHKLPYNDFSAGMKGDTVQQRFRFDGGDYTAVLYLCNEEGDNVTYHFQFESWKTNQYGAAFGAYRMNMLITAIEKMFLNIDPNTQVKSWYIDTKTKSSFF